MSPIRAMQSIVPTALVMRLDFDALVPIRFWQITLVISKI